jgi:ParB family chromosome partitioning protein
MSVATAQKKGLGKGLSALMNDVAAPVDITRTVQNDTRRGIDMLAVDLLQSGVYQPRRNFDEEVLHELADSIEKNGIMQPIIVRKAGDKYEIIAGERRWRAAKLAKLSEVPVIIRSVSDAQALELALIENIQRADLNPLEEAAGYQRLMDEFKYTQEKLASIVGKSRSHVANLLRLLELPDAIKKLVDKGKLTMGHARALLTAKSPETLAKQVVEQGLNVRQTEDLAKGLELATPQAKASAKGKASSKENHGQTSGKSDEVQQIEAMLAENLGLKVSLNTRSTQAGDVVISYDSLAQLDEILRRIGGTMY